MDIVTETIIYLIAINIITFLAMFIDKRKAEKGTWRISEGTLFMLALGGGSIGGILGMIIFRHKIRKLRFTIGFPAILIFEVASVLFYMFV